jgi:acid phosphatase
MNRVSRLKRSHIYGLTIFLMFAVLGAPAFALTDRDIPNLKKIKEMVIQYRDSGNWKKQIDEQANQAIALLEETPRRNAKQAIVFDIDETTLDNYEYYKNNDFAYIPTIWFEWVDSAKAPSVNGAFRIYAKALEKGVAVFFITGRSEKSRAGTEKNLAAAGYAKYERLIMRDKSNLKEPAGTYKALERKKIERRGYKIILNVGDQWSDLVGGSSGRAIKLPNPMYLIP